MNQNQSFLKGCKKIMAVISLLCLLFAFSGVTASAAGNPRVTVSSGTVERGAEASVSFNLEGNPGIWGIKLRIHYDHSALTLKSVTTGSVFEKGELTLSQDLNKDPYVVVASCNSLENKTVNGTIVALNFAVSGSAEFKAYPVTVEVSQANNVDGKKIEFKTLDGSVTVVSCVHANTEWRVTKAAGCEDSGKETLTCKKCGKTFETKAVNATGHKNTEVRNAVAATKAAEGYTGDTYCKACGKLIKKGQAIARLKENTPVTPPPATDTTSTATPTTSTPADEPTITKGNAAVFNKDAQEALVFVSNADFGDFIRVEIDGSVLDEKDYTVESGSTIVTVSKDYLGTLGSGEHTISIVSKSGTADASFTVRDSEDTEGTASTDTVNPPRADLDGAEKTSSATSKIIAVLIVVVLAGGFAAFWVIKKRRG